MISFKDLLGDNSLADVPLTHQQNLQELLKRVNKVLEAYGQASYIVTSGYRSAQQHKRIYDTINLKRSKNGQPPLAIPLGSAHLQGMAVDIYDPDLHLTDWLKNDRVGITMLQTHDLYCEDGNANWVHFQTRPTKYGHWFKP